MRKVLGLVGATLLFAGPALAADLGRPPAYKAAPLAPVFSWTGFYLGVHGGYGWSSSDVFGVGVFDSLKGGFGGGQIGYNYQVNNFVLGIEGDGAWADISQSFDGAKFKFDALASLRGRLGVAFGNTLLYGTAGGGWAHGKFDILGLSDSQWHNGWTAGAGIEYAFLPNWSAKVEYLHYGLSSATYFSSLGGADSGKVDVDTIKVGINYLFH